MTAAAAGCICAVVTGDGVRFSRLTAAQRRTVLDLLESLLGGIESLFGLVAQARKS